MPAAQFGGYGEEALGEAIAAVFALAGAKTELTGSYDGWNPDMESPILKAMTASYEALYGKKPAVTAIHAGLECGIIGSKYPKMDMISFGPTICYPPLARREGGDRFGRQSSTTSWWTRCATFPKNKRSVVANPETWFVIVNPVAGAAAGSTTFRRSRSICATRNILCEPVFTEHKFHATELTVWAVREGYRRIIVVGGDGTLHEVVNGLFIQQEVCPSDVLLAVVAVGTGNDWVRTFGISNRYQDAAKAISEGYSFLQDVGVVSPTRRRTTARAATWPMSPGPDSTPTSCASSRT